MKDGNKVYFFGKRIDCDSNLVNYNEVLFDINSLNINILEIAKSYHVDVKTVYCYAYATVLKSINDNSLFYLAYKKKDQIYGLEIDLTDEFNEKCLMKIDKQIMNPSISLQNEDKLLILTDCIICFDSEIEDKFSLNLQVTMDNHEVKCRLFGDNLFLSKDYLKFIYLHFKTVIESLLDRDCIKQNDINLISEQERSLIETKFNDTFQEFSHDLCIHQVFERSVDNNPENLFIIYQDQKYTYSQANKIINRVAKSLRSFINKSDLIMIISERSPEMIFSVFSVLKAGGCYVPVDAKLPFERIKYIIEDCHPKYILNTTTANFDKFEIQTIDFKSLLEVEHENNEIQNINSPDDLALIIYTSGTTGRPKGVQIEHHSVVNYCEYNYKRFNIGKNDVVLQFASFMFSTYILELNTTAFSGACICLINENDLKNIQFVERFIEKNNVTLLLLPPQYCHLINIPSKVRIVQTGGMSTTNDVVNKIKQSCRYLNGYGLSEGGVCTVWEYQGGDVPKKIPIGKPVANVKLYVFNGEKECGIYMPGELCVTGQSLARGYVGNKQLTDSKFINNPFGDGKMLRTGDIVQWLPDGNMEYLGRLDTQVQLNGIRVEIDEVENVIRTITDIDNAVVVPHKSNNNIYLIAYYLSKKNLSNEYIRKEIEKILPQYMIPSKFFQIEEIPLTDNGKIDVKRLPQIEYDINEYFSSDIKGRILRLIYKLTNKRIETSINFLQFGMNSLDMIRLVNEIEKEFSISLSIDEIYKNPCVEKIRKIIENKLNTGSKVKTIKHLEEKGNKIATSTQLGIYLECKKNELDTSYNLPFLAKYKGKLNIDKLEKCLEDMVAEHSVLRTTFSFENNNLVQNVNENVDVRVNRKIDDGLFNNADALYKLIRPFNLNYGPLLRLEVYECNKSLNTIDAHDGMIFLDIHHIIFDGISVNLFILELFNRYFGKVTKRTGIEFFDYCRYISTKNKTENELYFANRTKNEIFRAPSLISDYVESYNLEGDTFYATIPNNLKEQIKNLCFNLKITEYTYYCTAFALMLSKYTCNNDIGFGIVLSGRNLNDIHNILGMFVNTQIYNFHVSNNSVYNILNESMEQIIQIQKHQQITNEKIESSLKLNGQDSLKSLLDILFVFENIGEVNLDFGELILERIPIPKHQVQSKLAFIVNTNRSENEIEIEYRRSLFDKESIKWYFKHYLCILNEMLDINKKYHEIEMFNSDEMQLVLNKFNETEYRIENRKRFANLFEDQAVKFPDRIAICDNFESYTYSELNSYASKISSMLIAKGISPGMKVAVIAKRQCFAVAAMLGIAKIDCVYVPIDHSYPYDRIKYILDDSRVELVLSDYDETYDGLMLIHKNEINNSIENSNYLFTNETSVNLPLYIIYTSGTTGKPKGIIISNSGLNDLREHFIRNQGITETDRVLQFASFSFDASISEFTMSILCGASLYIVSEEIRNDPYLLEKFIKDYKITIGILPPMILDIINLSSMKSVISAGAELSPLIAEKHRGIRISNDYGPTEVTVCATHFEYTGNSLTKRIPIGKPIENKKVYILNEDQICGVYVPGEICTSGSGLAIAYLNNNDLTKRMFTSNSIVNSRLYHTGDLGRWLPDGNIEFLGRIDEQVKVNGYRVEIKEIENVIKNLKYVDNVAVCYNPVGEDMALCAYVMLNKDKDTEFIKSQCKKFLPKYMVPSYWYIVEKIPYTINGKLDIKSLRNLKGSHNETNIVEPSNYNEEVICEIFKRLLNTDFLGIDDSFIKHGGNSLLLMKLCNEIDDKLNIRLKVSDVLSDDTVRGLTSKINIAKNEGKDSIPKTIKKLKYKLSPNQLGIYYYCQKDPSSVAYNMPQFSKLKGSLDVDKLRTSLKEVCKKNSILRTRFIIEDDQVYQTISDDVNIEMEYIKCDNTDLKFEIDNFIKPFDLSNSPLLRVKLIEIKNDEYIFAFDVHHIISDGISMSNLCMELSNYYNGLKDNDSIEFQYIDYCEWLNCQDTTEALRFWKKTFKDTVPVLNFPTDYQRLRHFDDNGEIIRTKLDPTICQKINRVSREFNITEYTIFITALSILCQRYSRQDDFIIGTVTAGRSKIFLEGIIGMFANTIPLRIQIEQNMKVEEFLKNLQKNIFEVLDYQNFSYENIIEHLDFSRDINRNPLFDIMFVMQNNVEPKLNLQGITSESIKIHSKKSKFDLTFQIGVSKNNYDLSIEYKTSLFNKNTIEIISKYYTNILDQLVTNINQKINEIELIDEDEKKNLLRKIKTKIPNVNINSVIATLFEEVANKYSDNIALVEGTEQITYRLLNEKSNILAHELINRGAGPEKFICLYFDKSIDMIISILAVIKTGAAYVPINTNYPKVRVDYIIEDCKPVIILTNKDIDFNSSRKNVIKFPVTFKNDDDSLKENLDIVIRPENALYVIYTSGTTGNPKGVIVENRNLISLFFNSKHPFKFKSDDVWTMFHAYGFDFSVWEIFGALLYGGKLVIVKEDVSKDSYEFLKLLISEKVTVLNQVPSSFYNLIRITKNESLSLRYVIFGGEFLNVSKLYKWHEMYPNVKLINMYGITETTIHVTYNEISDNEIKYGINHIGECLDTLNLYIINNGHLCGIGEPGELCVSGEGLTRGYINNSKLTSMKFIDNPFDNGRLYCSGDLAKRDFDGRIKYLGRIDEQIQIHGYRVELGEVESALKKILGIDDAIAIVKSNSDESDTQIIGYYVSNEEFDLNYLRKELLKLLPSYMVPSYIIRINQIPTTINGKLDKKSLPSVDKTITSKYILPVNEMEIILCKILEEVLEKTRVGIDDSFYELGGDSISALRVVSKLRNLGYDLKIKTILEEGIISKIATRIKKNVMVNYDQNEFTGFAHTTPIIDEFNNWKLPVKNYYNQSVLISIEKEKFEHFLQALTMIVKYHDILRAVYKNNKLYVRPFSENDCFRYFEFNLESNRLDNAGIKEACIKVQSQIDLSNGPLIHIAAFKGLSRIPVLICIHHLIIDGISWRILLEDLEELMYQINSKIELKLPLKTASFDLWSKSLKKYLFELKSNSKEEKYWLDVFNNSNENCFSYDKTKSFKGYSQLTFSLSQLETENLINKTYSSYNTDIQDILIAALGITIYKINNFNSAIIYLEGHGRYNLGKYNVHNERTVGWFTNIYPVKVHCTSNIEESIIANKELLRKVPNHGIGYAAFSKNINYQNIEICFNYLGNINEKTKIKRLSLDIGRSISEQNFLPGRININGTISDGRLIFVLDYLSGIYNVNEMSTFLQLFKTAIQDCISHCLQNKYNIRTISDVTTNDVSSEDLEIIDELDFE